MKKRQIEDKLSRRRETKRALDELIEEQRTAKQDDFMKEQIMFNLEWRAKVMQDICVLEGMLQ